MAIQDIYEWVEGDTGPLPTTTLINPNGEVQNLVNVQELLFYMKTWPGGEDKITGEEATVLSAGAGEVTYVRTAADTDTPGEYRCQYRVVYADNTVQWFPTDPIRVIINPNLL